MASTLGKRRYALPIVVILAVLIIFPTMFYPMANMQVKDLPFAFLNHDKEIATAQGPMNLGSKVAEQIGGSAQLSSGRFLARPKLMSYLRIRKSTAQS